MSASDARLISASRAAVAAHRDGNYAAVSAIVADYFNAPGRLHQNRNGVLPAKDSTEATRAQVAAAGSTQC